FWVAVAQVWTRFPFAMVVLLAALQSIPQDVVEAARVDGARPAQVFRSVTFPMLLPAFTVALAVEFIVTFQIFDVIWSLTAGGAGAVEPGTGLLDRGQQHLHADRAVQRSVQALDPAVADATKLR